MVAAILVSVLILRLHTLGRHLWSLHHSDVGDAAPISSRCKRPKRYPSVIPGHRRWFVQESGAAILRPGDEGSTGQFGRESSERNMVLKVSMKVP